MNVLVITDHFTRYAQAFVTNNQRTNTLAKEHIDKDVARRKLYYDWKYHCMEIIPGDIVLVRQKVFRSDHKIADRWEIPVYKVLEKHGDGTSFYSSKNWTR